MNKIIIVDDKEPSKTTVAYWIAQEIEEITNGEYSGALLEGVIIAEALALIKDLVRELGEKGDNVVGLLVDFVDETHGVREAGAQLLEKVKADPKLEKIPVVVYSAKHTVVPVADLREHGAKGFIRREVTRGRAGDLGRQILEAFEIPYEQPA